MAGLFKRNGFVAYAVFDEETRKQADDMPVGPSWTSESLLNYAEQGRIFRSESLEDLAEQAKINVAPLLGTIEKYNESCADGVDHDYFKPIGLLPIKTPPYYAVEVRPSVIAWTGYGLRTGPETNVIGKDERSVQGLFAAGETVGTLHGDRYIGGGGSFGPALTFGRIAGREAARHALETAG